MTKQHLRVFRELLGSSDMDVRIEAGENLALLHESRIILGLAGGGMEEGGGAGRAVADGDEGGDEEDMGDQFDDDGAAEEEAMDLTVLWGEVVEEMKGFITDSSKKVIGAWRGLLLGGMVGAWGVTCSLARYVLILCHSLCYVGVRLFWFSCTVRCQL